MTAQRPRRARRPRAGAAKKQARAKAKARPATAAPSALDYEQSIRNILALYAYAPNNAMTWASVTSAVTNFLTELWSRGELSGRTARDAFAVQCGLGTTMTGQDILDGVMIVQVSLSLSDPTDFVELTVRQPMQAEA